MLWECLIDAIKQVVSERKTLNKYEVLNEGNGFADVMRKGFQGIGICYNPDRMIACSEGLVREGIDWQPGKKERGGIIVFSVEVNAVRQHPNKFINRLKQIAMTIANKFNATRKIDRIANDNNLVGWTIGHYLDGRYKAKNGKIYGEDSLSLEMVGINFDKLVKIAEELCRVFSQESVLVKDYSSGRVLFVKPN